MRVTLSLNHACNLRCTYCYTGEKFQKRMPWDVARRAVDLALQEPPRGRQATQISFFGGEPLLEVELMEQVMAYARESAAESGHSLLFHVATNATLMTPDVLDMLVREQVQVAVSLDGCRAAHEATRPYASGASSFEAVVDNLRALLRRVPPGTVTVQCVVDPANVRFLPESLDFLLGLGVVDIRLNLNHSGNWDQHARRELEEALGAMGERYVEAHRRGVHFTLVPLDDKINSHLRTGCGAQETCDFGTRELAVAPSGRLYPCDRLIGEDDRDDLVIGTVFDGVDVARRDALVERKNSENEDCAQCELAPRCTHSCACVNHMLTGDVGEVSGLLCWLEQQWIAQADRSAAALYQDRVPAFLERFYPPVRGVGSPLLRVMQG